MKMTGKTMTAPTQSDALNLRGHFPGAMDEAEPLAARSFDRMVADVRVGTRSRVGVTVHMTMADAEIAWRAFEADAVGLGFQNFDWLKAWYSQVGEAEGVEPAIVITSLDGVPVMLTPFGIERRYGQRCLVWLGGRFADYKAPMLARDFETQVSPDLFASMWEKIRQHLPAHDFIALENQPSHVGLSINPFTSLSGETAADDGYVFPLPATYEEFTQTFRSGTRRADRAKLRKLEAMGRLEFKIAETSDEARLMVADILDRKAMQLRAQGISSIFEDAGYRAAYVALAALPPKRKMLQVAMMTLDGEFISGSIAHFRQGHMTLMVHTYEHAFARLSPGRLLLLNLIKTSIGEGHKIYDLSVGYAAYKDSFCDEPMPLSNYVAAAKPWGLAAASAERAKLGLKRRVKDNVTLMGWLRGWRQKFAGA
tara:strand:- start:82 stop:1356 length:1275 start_codon:yes stop_codon:yes gene_type:complete